MPQEALPFGTPSEPGDDPLADAIERALADAGLRDGGSAEASSLADGDHDAPHADANPVVDPDGD